VHVQVSVHPLALRLVEPLKLALIVGIAYTLAATGWSFFSDPVPTTFDGPAKSAARTPVETLSIEQIVAAHLFGITDATTSAAPAAFDAPETRLKLTLEGVFRSEDPQRSAAIIAAPGRPGELYVVGAKLPGNVELAEVHADRVVLRRGGLLETLRFPTEPGLIAGTIDESLLPTGDVYVEEPAYEPPLEPAAESYNESSQNDTTNPADALREGLAEYRQRLAADPEGTLESLGLSAVSTEGTDGYRLGALAQSPYLAQTGLQPGDVVLSVNGRPVGNAQRDQLEIDNIMAQGSARLEVQRGDRRFFVTASLK